jgi:16S rRNA (guanine527-N7)-methyltransferase
MKTWNPEDGFPPGLSLMIPFQDPENVGAVIRSAVAFGAQMVILLGECAHPYHPKTLRASGGAVLYAPLFQGPSIKDLPEDMPVLTLSPDGKDISEFRFPKRFAVLPGLEGKGLPNHLRRHAYSIPIRPDVESLNAAAATSIVLYLWEQSMKTRAQSDHGMCDSD